MAWLDGAVGRDVLEGTGGREVLAGDRIGRDVLEGTGGREVLGGDWIGRDGLRGDWIGRVRAGRADLFAYGTLQFAEVLGALLGRVPEHRPAAVAGWRAACLRRLSYPGLVTADAVADGGLATGILLTGLSEADWRILDAYEDAEYDLMPVELADAARALTFRYTRSDLVLPQTWSAAEFAVRHLPAFAEQCRSWRITQAPVVSEIP